MALHRPAVCLGASHACLRPPAWPDGRAMASRSPGGSARFNRAPLQGGKTLPHWATDFRRADRT